MVEGIGAELRRMREQRGFSQKTLGDATGMKREYLCKLETGALPNPTPATLKKLVDVLNYKLSDLFKAIGE